MEYEKFKEALTNEVSRLLGGAEISIRRYVKMNGLAYDGLTVFDRESNLSPTIPLTQFYEQYTTGRDLCGIAEEVVSFYREYKVPGKVSVDHFSDYGWAKEKLRVRLINRVMNVERLKDVPYRTFLDLAECVYLDIDDLGIPNATCPVRDRELKSWGKTFEEVLADAEENMKVYEPGELSGIGDVIRDLKEELRGMAGRMNQPEDFFLGEEQDEIPAPPRMFVLTTKGKTFGAAAILDKSPLRTLANLFGADVYVIPSSIHEVILLPDEEGTSAENLREMLVSINRCEVPQGDILSNHVYRYERESDELVIAG